MEKTQPTPIQEEEYQKFKQFVQDVHGSTRGNLRTEIENALRQYRETYYGGDRLKRIEEDMSTIMAALVDAESDGGEVAPTLSNGSDTHARESAKPAPNQPRQTKIDWLVSRFLESSDCNNDSGMVARGDVERLVNQKYSFSDDLQTGYVDEVFDKIVNRFDAEPHPVHGNFFVWGKRLEQAKEKAQQEADSEIDEIIE